MKINWKHKSYSLKDIPDLEKFFIRNYRGTGRYGTEEFFQWKIVDNPFNKGIIKLVKDNEKIISLTSACPKELILNGTKVVVAEVGDTYTDFDYYRKGLFTVVSNATSQECFKNGILFIYGLPNQVALPGWQKKANYKIMSKLNVKSLILPLDITYYLKRYNINKIGKYSGRILSKIYFKFLSLKLNLLISTKKYKVEEVNRLPDEWDAFWEMAHSQYDFILSRDIRALNWRFFKNPNEYKFYILKKDGCIVGYMIYRIVNDKDRKILTIADFLFIPGYESGLYQLLLKILLDACQNKITTLYLWYNQGGPYFNFFKKSGFFTKGNVPVIRFINEFSDSLEENCNSWHFTISDSDNV